MKKPTPKKRAPRVAITPEQRYHMINDAAYFRVAKRQQETDKPQNQALCWCEVEAEIDAVLNGRRAG